MKSLGFNISFNRGIGYTVTAAGIAIAISCNYVLLLLLGFDNSFAEVTLRNTSIFEVFLAGILIFAVIGPFLELASLYPGSSGIRTYTHKSLGNRPSLIITTSYLLVLLFIAGIESFLLLTILSQFIDRPWALTLVVCILGFIIAINMTSVKKVEKVQLWSTVILWLGSMALCWAAYATAEPSNIVSPWQTFSWIDNVAPVGVTLAIFLFIGVELACSSVKHPDDYFKTLPRAVYAAVFIIAVLYISMCYVILIFPPTEDLNDSPLLFFANVIDSKFTIFIALFLTIQALITSFNSGLKGASRMTYLLAREGVISHKLTKISSDGNTPINSVLIISGAAIFTCFMTNWLGLSRELSSLSASLISLVYASLLISSCGTKNRKKQIKNYYICRVPHSVRYALSLVFISLSFYNLSELTMNLKGQILTGGTLMIFMYIWLNWKPSPLTCQQAR